MSLRNPNVRTVRSAHAVRNGEREWFRIRNSTEDVATIDLFDEIGFFGITALDFQRELRAVTAPKITLNINSPGGDVFDAVAIFNLLRDHKAEITAYNLSLAASAASFIPLAADKVITARHSQWMVHDAWGLAIGNSVDMREMADFLEKQSGVIAEIYSERAGGTVAEWRDRMAAETWYTDSEAVEVGLADEIGGAEAAKNGWDLSLIFKHPPSPRAEVEPQTTEVEPPDGRRRAAAQLALASATLEVATWRR